MKPREQEKIRQSIQHRYGKIAQSATDCGNSTPNTTCCDKNINSNASCCGGIEISPEQISRDLGYSANEIKSIPMGANMGLGCGNPVALASITQGETVLDLGSGGGFDCFLAAKKVGESGYVIGVDMTPEMIRKARNNLVKTDIRNVEFRLGEIENIPAADNSVDIIMSNCVINLSPDKKKVANEAFRVLKPGGRLAISDIVARAPLPEALRNDLNLISACVGGAATIDDFQIILKDAGFKNITIIPKEGSRELVRKWGMGENIENFIVSANIQAIKPL